MITADFTEFHFIGRCPLQRDIALAIQRIRSVVAAFAAGMAVNSAAVFRHIRCCRRPDPLISPVSQDMCIHCGQALVQPAAPEAQTKPVIGNKAEA